MADFDPVTTASQLANAYVQAMQDQITSRKTAAQKTSTGLNTLKSALTAFNTALSGLSSTTGSKGLRQYTATLSESIGTASATSNAQAGTYSFHVE